MKLKNFIFLLILALMTLNSSAQDISAIDLPEMTYIDGNIFWMGRDGLSHSEERPAHQVLVDSFYMSKYEVTNKQYCQFDPNHPNPGDDLPVVNITWYDAMNYCEWVTDKTGKYCRLPKEAEWEYACRANSFSNYYWGDDMNGDYCWYSDNSVGQLQKVGQKRPNKFGLYDMSGNVWEWCYDWYRDGYYVVSPFSNPDGPTSGWGQVIRGGSFKSPDYDCRSSRRMSGDNLGSSSEDLGFRIVIKD